MPKTTCEQTSRTTGVEVEIDPEGFAVFVSLRDTRTPEKRVTLKLHRRAAASLRALLAGSENEQDETLTAILRGEMTVTEGKANAEPAIPTG